MTKEKVVKAIVILALSKQYSAGELYELFYLLMGPNATRTALWDTWEEIKDHPDFMKIFPR